MNTPLFEYRLRESQRARQVRLRVSLERGLEVVVPAGYKTKYIPRLLEEKQAWIRAALERSENYKKLFAYDSAWSIPEQIVLPAVGLRWEVCVRATDAAGVRIRELGPERLEISGRVRDADACRRAFARWLRQRGDEYLTPTLQALSAQTGLRYRDVHVRRQKTRWGSCSPDKVISLNAKLLFFPPEIMRYVLVHELCHLAEMNHSPRFWRLVGRYCPDYQRCRTPLREAWRYVPHWAQDR